MASIVHTNIMIMTGLPKQSHGCLLPKPPTTFHHLPLEIQETIFKMKHQLELRDTLTDLKRINFYKIIQCHNLIQKINVTSPDDEDKFTHILNKLSVFPMIDPRRSL